MKVLKINKFKDVTAGLGYYNLPPEVQYLGKNWFNDDCVTISGLMYSVPTEERTIMEFLGWAAAGVVVGGSIGALIATLCKPR